MSWQQGLREYIEFLQQKHGLTPEQIRDELLTERIPVEAFATDATPLQTAAQHLAVHYNKTARDIGRILGRTTTEVDKFLEASKKLPAPPRSGTILLPATLFADRTLSASEHLVAYLESQGLSVAEIAVKLRKAEPTIWTLHYRVAKKRGGKQ
jgi:DNA-binding CsgD family transcriptional regulator